MNKKDKSDINLIIGIPAVCLGGFCIYLSIMAREVVYGIVYAVSRNLDISQELSKNLKIGSGYFRGLLNNTELFIDFLIIAIPLGIALLFIVFSAGILAEFICKKIDSQTG